MGRGVSLRRKRALRGHDAFPTMTGPRRIIAAQGPRSAFHLICIDHNSFADLPPLHPQVLHLLYRVQWVYIPDRSSSLGGWSFFIEF